jgi:hypothetical protein
VGFGTTFKGTGGAETSSLKRLTGGISLLVSDFVEASRTFFGFPSQKDNCEKHKRSVKNDCFEF